MLFMGTEYGQFREWDYENSLEWFMLDYPKHKAMREYVASLNAFYSSRSELWELDFSPTGFEWILADESEKNIVAFRRKNIKGESVTVVLSFSGADQTVSIPVASKSVKKLFDTGNVGDESDVFSFNKLKGGYALDVKIPRFSGIIFKENKKSNKKTLKENKNVL